MLNNEIYVDIADEVKYNKREITMTFKTILELNKENQLNLNPDYQRGIVWNNSKQSSLIESIIQGYYYPPIIFNLKDGIYICVDGKQRITSVLKFLNNEITYTYNDEEILFSNFDRQSKEQFYTKNFQTCIYTNIDEETELEIFRRVQKGEPMNKIELLRSYNSELIINIKNKTDNYKSIFKKYDIKMDRDMHLQYIIRVLMLQYTDKDFITLTSPEMEKFAPFDPERIKRAPREYKTNKDIINKDVYIFINYIFICFIFLRGKKI